MFSINKFTLQSINSVKGRLNNYNMTEIVKNKTYIKLSLKKLTSLMFFQG